MSCCPGSSGQGRNRKTMIYTHRKEDYERIQRAGHLRSHSRLAQIPAMLIQLPPPLATCSPQRYPTKLRLERQKTRAIRQEAVVAGAGAGGEVLVEQLQVAGCRGQRSRSDRLPEILGNKFYLAAAGKKRGPLRFVQVVAQGDLTLGNPIEAFSPISSSHH